jgi:uncharacterized LabA/DUF88 family protein
MKDLGLGVVIAMGWIKPQNRQDSDSVSNGSNKWQEISTLVTDLSQSLENTNRQIQNIDFNIVSGKLDKASERVSKLEKRFDSQQKQQNQIRSAIDKLQHKTKNWNKNDRQDRSYKKNFDYLGKPNKFTSQLIEQQSTTHVYIDGNNLKCSAYKLNLDIDYQALKSFLMPDNGKIRLNFYNGACQTSRGFHSHLNRLGYIVNALPKRNHSDGTHKTVGDDVSMAINILDKVKAGDRLILISGDGDFFPVIEKMQQRWVKVIVTVNGTTIIKAF